MKAQTTANQNPKAEAAGTEKLEVTVIPVDEEPYSKVITIPSTGARPAGSGQIDSQAQFAGTQQYPSLKDIFQAKQTLWKPIFGSYVSPNKQPLFSIFRKKITIKPQDRKKENNQYGEEIGLHILFLKCDGNRFPRNAFANQLEVYCSTYFYGPLVIVYGELTAPYKLHSFLTNYLMERIQPLNEEEQKIYPLPFSAKKCATVRNLMADRKFSQDLEQPEKTMSVCQFMIYSYKTSFCPYINKKHEWSECNYAHRQQDFRRPPHLFFYYIDKCSYVEDDGSWDKCPDFLDCQYSHTLVEQLFSPLNYKLNPCPDRTPELKSQCKKRLDLCCHYHSLDERNDSFKALKNPPKNLPEHESMQDYIDIIEQEGLLNTKEDPFEGMPVAQSEQPSHKPGQNQSSCKTAPKKAALAKLPEENTDAWKQLEQAMNQKSIKKTDKEPFPATTQEAQAMPMPKYESNQPFQTVMAKGNSQNFENMGAISDYNSTLEAESFPASGKKQQSLFKSYSSPKNATQPAKPQAQQEDDYLQQMIQANATKGGTSSFAQPALQTQNDQIKVIKSERKQMKKKKKNIIVQEYSDEVAKEVPSEEKKGEDPTYSDRQADQESHQDSKTGDDVEEYRSASSKASPSGIAESAIEDAVSEECDNEIQETFSNGEPEVAEFEDEVEPRVHKKTQKITQKYNDEIEQLKNFLNESINEKDSAKKKQNQKINDQTPGIKYTQLKQAAQHKNRGGLTGKRDDTLFTKMGDNFKEQSRFCQLQNSSSSSSEKDLAYNVKKYSATFTQEVPEDDRENNDDHQASDSKKREQSRKMDDGESRSSLFSFNFLGEEPSSLSPDPKAGFNFSDPAKGVHSTKPTPEQTNSSGIGSVGDDGMIGSMNNHSDGSQPNYVKYFNPSDKKFNEKTKFSSVKVDADKDPKINIDHRSQMGPVTIIENHYNNHTTINNFFQGSNKQQMSGNMYGGMNMGQPNMKNMNSYVKNLSNTYNLVTIQIINNNDGRGPPPTGVNQAMLENLFAPQYQEDEDETTQTEQIAMDVFNNVIMDSQHASEANTPTSGSHSFRLADAQSNQQKPIQFKQKLFQAPPTLGESQNQQPQSYMSKPKSSRSKGSGMYQAKGRKTTGRDKKQ